MQSERLDLLKDVVFVDLEILACQVEDRVVIVVGDEPASFDRLGAEYKQDVRPLLKRMFPVLICARRCEART